MSVARLVDAAAALPASAVGGIAAAAAFLLVLAAAAQLSVRRLRAQLAGAEEELVDRTTGLLPRSALRVRLGAEVAWAATSRTPIAVAMLRIRGSRFAHAARVLRHGMREEEVAFLAGDQHVVVELWGADAVAAGAAVRRLGSELAAAGHPVVDAGIACSPRDGSDVETLVAAARRDLRPIDDPRLLGTAPDGEARAPGASTHLAVQVVSTVTAFVACALLLFTAWRLVPAAVEPTLRGDGRSAAEWVVLLVTLLGLPAGAALLHATLWDRPPGAPASFPRNGGGRATAVTIAALVGVPLAWSILVPEAPPGVTTALGATLAVLALVVLTLVHARRLVVLPTPLLLALVAAGAAITWYAVELAQLPVVANAGRLLAAAALGASLARLVDRASWIAGLALVAAVVDIWSVVADTGVTNRLLESDSAAAGRTLDLLLFTGPDIDGAPTAALGVADLVYLALFLGWAYGWRVDMRVAGAAMLGGTWAALAVSEVLDALVPVLPFLAVGMLAIVALRSRSLRRQVAAWRAGTGWPDGDEAAG